MIVNTICRYPYLESSISSSSLFALFPDGSVSVKTAKKTKYVVNFELTDLKSFKRSSPSLGWSYLIFIMKDGTTYPALHFHQGGSKALMKEMERYLYIKKYALLSWIDMIHLCNIWPTVPIILLLRVSSARFGNPNEFVLPFSYTQFDYSSLVE